MEIFPSVTEHPERGREYALARERKIIEDENRDALKKRPIRRDVEAPGRSRSLARKIRDGRDNAPAMTRVSETKRLTTSPLTVVHACSPLLRFCAKSAWRSVTQQRARTEPAGRVAFEMLAVSLLFRFRLSRFLRDGWSESRMVRFAFDREASITVH